MRLRIWFVAGVSFTGVFWRLVSTTLQIILKGSEDDMYNMICTQGCEKLLEDPISGEPLLLDHEPDVGCDSSCGCHEVIANSQAAHDILLHDGLRTMFSLARPVHRPRKTA